MARTISIGAQSFSDLREKDLFYVDKTHFIKEWWEKTSSDVVTLITRPRRFGKTLNMSMLECFFSSKYRSRSTLFEGLYISKDPELMRQQGRWPVVALSFAGIKYRSFESTGKAINMLITEKYREVKDFIGAENLTEEEQDLFARIDAEMDDTLSSLSVQLLCGVLNRHYGEKVIILLDEYDTPMQEAWMNGYWDEMVSFVSALAQIEEKKYETDLLTRGIRKDRIYKYGFAFQGKKCLIGIEEHTEG